MNAPLVFDFNSGQHDWIGDFCDFTDGTEPERTVCRVDALPPSAPKGLLGKGLQLAATNRSDDLFMFIKRRLSVAEGIRPDTDYQVSFVLDFLSDAPSGCAGIGGPPGEAVFLKAGASGQEPRVVKVDGYYGLSVDKGEGNNSSGIAASDAGNIANGIPCCDAQKISPMPFGRLVRRHTHAHLVRSSANGDLWLLVGTDSGFEDRTTLFYLKIEVHLRRVDPVG
jgi:hypothetical protein